MFLKINPYKFFFITVLFSVFLGYIFNSGIIAYGPLIIFSLIVILHEFIQKKPINRKHLFISLAWLPYVIWAGIIYISNPLEGRYLNTNLLSIFILPITTLVFFRFYSSYCKYNNHIFIYNSLLTFLILQLIICIGQISTYTLGVGFPVSELHAGTSMITGTFSNSNDLGAVTLVILFIALGIEKLSFKKNKYLFSIVAASLLIITSSRSAIFIAIFIFIFYKSNSLKKIIIYSFLFLLLGIFFIFIINNIENETFSRILFRLNSLDSILDQGISSDNSMSIRLSSYLNFLEKLPELGFGSGEINNYFKYSTNTNFQGVYLLFQNPHSLIVEIGYWLGWPGLLFFFAPIVFLFFYSKRKFLLTIVLLTASSIPSSILGSMTFFFLFILSFFDFRKIDMNTIHNSNRKTNN